MEQGDEIIININYSTKLFKQETIERAFIHFAYLIEQVNMNRNILLSELSVLTLPERKQILELFNDTAVEYPKEKTIHGWFEEQVERTPNAVALLFEEERMTYREFNERSNQLARVLRAKGTTTDKLVPIMVERSIDMMIGIMGILSRGRSRLPPIDPQFPTSELRTCCPTVRHRCCLLSRISKKKCCVGRRRSAAKCSYR